MLKILSVIAIILICGFIGFSLSKYYINRKKYFTELSLFLNSLSLDINFTQEKLIPIIEKNINNINLPELKLTVSNYLSLLKNKKDIEKDLVFTGVTILKNNEKEYLYTFFKGLGRFDCNNQLKEFEKYSKVIDTSIAETTKDSSKYASLYTKLGIIFGLFLALILL